MKLNTIILQFSDNLEILRTFVDLVNPILSKKLSDELKKNEPIFSSFIRSILDEWEIDEIPEELKTDLDKYPDNDFKFELSKNEKDEIIVSMSAKDGKIFKNTSKNIRKYSNQESLLYRSSLISLVSFSEWFLSQLFHFYFNKFPEAISIRDRNLTFEQLEFFNSVDDAKHFLIDSKIEEILRGNIEIWFLALKKELNLSLQYIAPFQDLVSEIYQRRNLLVHNGGVINSVYLSKVSSDLLKDLKKGDIIEISREYLDKSISLFEKIFILIGSELWKKIERDNKERASLLLDIIYDRLLDENWDIAESLCFFLINDKGMPERDRLIAQINYWQSFKWQGNFKQVEQDIIDTDFSAKEEIFLLAKYALLDKYSDFYNLLPRLVRNEKISENDLFEWPLFKKIRKQKRFLKQMKKLFPDSKNTAVLNNFIFVF